MFRKQVFMTVCLVILTALLITGCQLTTPTPIAVTGVTLDQATMTLTAEGATGTITATVSPSNATNQSVTWSSSATAVATVVNGVVTPVAEGSTTITATAVDGGFTATCTVTITDPITITTNQSPTASFTATPTSGVAPLEVSFNASSSSDSDGSITSYAWDFKDGNTGTGQTINHTFSSAGSYNVLLTVTDDEGASDSNTKTITITNPIIEPVPLGTPLTKDGITVTMERIEVVEPSLYPPPYDFVAQIYFSIINNSERVLKTGGLGPATGSLFYVLDEKIYEDEFNSLGWTNIGDISWVYPGQSRSVSYVKYFHSPFTIKQITWTGTFADDQTEIELGPWEN